MVALATTIADGDVNVSLHAHLALKHPHDEIGILTQAFQRMVIYLSEMATVATRIATGDLRQTIAPLSARDVLGMAFHRMTELSQAPCYSCDRHCRRGSATGY